MTLTQEQIDFFHQNGYLALGKIFTDEEVASLRPEYDREFELAMEGGRFRNLAADGAADAATQKAAPQKMLQIIQMCERNMAFRRLVYDGRLLDIVQDILGPNIMLFHDQALFKPAFTGGPIHWHQDNAYWQCRPANLVSAWITLDDAVLENGAMQVIPGSHLRPAHHDAAPGNILLDGGSHVDESKAQVVELPAGGVMLHHCQTLHHTEPNTTPNQRRAYAIHYMTPGTRNSKDEPLHVGFNRPMLRISV